LGAVAAYLAVEQVSGLLPFSFAFAAGAMLSPVMVELLPQAFRAPWANRGRGRRRDGAATRVGLAAILGVE
jgi:zinc transporter ZupT